MSPLILTQLIIFFQTHSQNIHAHKILLEKTHFIILPRSQPSTGSFYDIFDITNPSAYTKNDINFIEPFFSSWYVEAIITSWFISGAYKYLAEKKGESINFLINTVLSPCDSKLALQKASTLCTKFHKVHKGCDEC